MAAIVARRTDGSAQLGLRDGIVARLHGAAREVADDEDRAHRRAGVAASPIPMAADAASVEPRFVSPCEAAFVSHSVTVPLSHIPHRSRYFRGLLRPGFGLPFGCRGLPQSHRAIITPGMRRRQA
jgi:hypothetical protein